MVAVTVMAVGLGVVSVVTLMANISMVETAVAVVDISAVVASPPHRTARGTRPRPCTAHYAQHPSNQPTNPEGIRSDRRLVSGSAS